MNFYSIEQSFLFLFLNAQQVINLFLLNLYMAKILKIIFERIEGLEPWGKLLGEESKMNKIRRKYKITKKITLEENE